jgi:hypothetical protein
MSVPIEDLIRDAQERQANRAVHPDRIRAGLPARRRRRVRHRQFGLVAVCAAVAGAAAVVAVPTLALNRHDNGNAAAQAGGPAGKPGANPTAQSASQPAPPSFAPVALGYTIGSPPAGLVERSRSSGSGNGLNPALRSRTWSAQPVDDYGDLKGSRLELYVQQTAASGQVSGVSPVTVGGKPGWYDGIDAPDKSYVAWKADAGTLVTVEQHGLNLSQAQLIGIAESVRPDPATLAPVVTFGWLPGTFSVQGVDLSGNSNTSWQGNVDLESVAGKDAAGRSLAGPSLMVELGTSVTATGTGEPVTVRGRTGKLINDPTGGAEPRLTLVVDLGDGTWLTLSTISPTTATPVSTDELLHVAEALQVAPPDLAWIGH